MRSVLVLLTVLSLAGGLTACQDEDARDLTSDTAEPETPVDEATVDQVLKNPESYSGATVVIRGAEFIPIEPEGAFVLQGRQGRILVSAPGGVPEIEEGESVPVRAEVVRFTEPAAEALGEQFANAEELADTPTEVGDPYLLLRSLPEAGAGAGAATGADASGSSVDLDKARAELAAVVKNPDSRYGDQVSVAGRVVRTGEAAFVLEAENQQLLVVPQSVPADIPQEGASVRARGEVERLPAEDDPAVVGETELFEDFEGQPTLAATEYEAVGS